MVGKDKIAEKDRIIMSEKEKIENNKIINAHILKDILPIVVLIGILVIFFWKVFFLGKVIFPADLIYDPNVHTYEARYYNWLLGDIFHQFYPWQLYAQESIKNGDIPLWNPYIFCGKPFQADSLTALFYPLNILYYILPIHWAITCQTILHLFLAGLFMYLYLRTIISNRFNSLVGAITFMLNGFFIAWMCFPNTIGIGIWIPLAFLMAEKILNKENKLMFIILSGIIIGIQNLSGQFQISFYFVLAFSLYYFFLLAWNLFKNRDIRKFLQYLLYFMIIGIIGFCIFAVQFLPSLDLYKFMFRRDASYEDIIIHAMPLIRAITFFIPDFFGNPVECGREWGPGINYIEHCGYVGLLPLIMFFIVLFSKKNRYSLFFIGLTIFSLLLNFGSPLYKLLYYSIPMFKSFMAPGRILFLYTFAISILTAFGLNALNMWWDELRLKGSVWKRKYSYIILCMIIIGAITILIPFLFSENIINYGKELLAHKYRTTGSPPGTHIYPLEHYYSEIPKIFYTTIKGISIFIPIFISFIILILLYLMRKIQLSVFRGLLLSLVVIDLLLFGMKFNTLSDPSQVFKKTELTEFISEDKSLFRIIRFGKEFIFRPNQNMVYKIQDVQGYSGPFILKNYPEFLRLIDEPQYSTYEEAFWYFSSPHNIKHQESLNSPLINLLNVKYVITTDEINNENYEFVGKKGLVRIYENKRCLPRAFMVYKAKVIKEKEDIFKELTSEEFNPKEYIILEKKPSKMSSIPIKDDAKISFVKYSGDEVIIKCHSKNDGFLVLTDTYHYSWKAFVDGIESEIYKTNYTFRSIYLEAGEHTIKFVYDPLSFKIGAYISSITMILLLLISLITIRRVNL